VCTKAPTAKAARMVTIWWPYVPVKGELMRTSPINADLLQP